MKFTILYEEGDRVRRYGGNGKVGGTVVDVDYYAEDGDWVSVKWDNSPDRTKWEGHGEHLVPEAIMPTPPKFSSVEDADAWLAEQLAKGAK